MRLFNLKSDAHGTSGASFDLGDIICSQTEASLQISCLP